VTTPDHPDPSGAADGSAAGVRFLDDVRVLEIASLAPTQLGMHLADLGAEVIKIEPPGRGDATRLVGTRPGFADSGLHRRWNRGKRSVAVDTRTAAGVDLVRRLVPHVDIVIEGLRPGTLARMGLAWEDLVELNPDLVMVALSGYGQTGSYRDMPGHGIGFDAVAGLADIDHDEDGRPRVRGRHVYYGAQVAPLFGATAALAALSWSRRTGQSVFLDVAQADAAAFVNYDVEDQVAVERATAAGTVDGTIDSSIDCTAPSAPRRADTAAPRSTMQAYRTRDGRLLLVMALERKFFVRLAEAVGRDDLIAQVPEEQHLVRGSEETDAPLGEIIASRNLDEWMEIFAAADVPVVPVNESDQVADDPHLRARIDWMEADQHTVTMKTPVRSEPRLAPPPGAQAVGQDTAEVLGRVGIDPATLAQLARDGVIGVAPEK
jgi:crotonobetainyl-CoA:carnitine CoA-transferase CaiB-like acyl-CoA transferase